MHTCRFDDMKCTKNRDVSILLKTQHKKFFTSFVWNAKVDKHSDRSALYEFSLDRINQTVCILKYSRKNYRVFKTVRHHKQWNKLEKKNS